MSNTKDYYLGVLVGEYILSNDLPTLSTDMLKTHRVIEVSKEDTDKNEKLLKKWLNSEKDSNGVNEHWQAHFDFMKVLEQKYLPKELVSRIPKIGLDIIDDMNELKKGIRETLWDSDVCSYAIGRDDIIVEKGSDGGWCDIVKLKLR